MEKPIIFVSHIHEDKDYAKSIKDWLGKSFLGAINVFVSSSPESLPPGSDWPHELKKSLEKASITLILISPSSISRQWIFFEAGAAYAKNLPVVPVCIAGTVVRDLSPPLSFLQALSLTEAQAKRDILKLIADSIGFHCPDTEDALSLPERTEENKSKAETRNAELGNDFTTTSFFDKPLSRSQARQLCNKASPDARKLLNDLLNLINIDSLKDSSDPENTLSFIKTSFQDSTLITGTDLDKMVSEAEDRYRNYKPKEDESDWQLGYKQVRIILDVASKYFMSKEDAIDQLLEQNPENCVPCLIAQFYSPKLHRQTKNIIFDILTSGDYGVSPLRIIEDYIHNNNPGNSDFKKAVGAARRTLNEDFNGWYVKIRGLHYSEDMSRYEERQQKERELELEERRQRMEFDLKMKEKDGVKE